MIIYFFTDFGPEGIYTGQMEARLIDNMPNVRVIELMNNVPAYQVGYGAILLDALEKQLPDGYCILAVIDPGVGSERKPVIIETERGLLVGPDNGLFSRFIAQEKFAGVYEIPFDRHSVSSSFHGRDVFAPAVIEYYNDSFDSFRSIDPAQLLQLNGLDTLDEVIYLDHFGNAMTSICATNVTQEQVFVVDDKSVSFARTFSSGPENALFWYRNSLGLVEIAVNQGKPDLKIGMQVRRKNR